MNEEAQNQAIFIEMATEDKRELVEVNLICRLCANKCDKLVPIYNDKDVNTKLATKINTYLPIKVDKTDVLPLQCCWHCTSTVFAWHELVLTCVEADQRFKNVTLFTMNDTECPLINNEDGGSNQQELCRDNESTSEETTLQQNSNSEKSCHDNVSASCQEIRSHFGKNTDFNEPDMPLGNSELCETFKDKDNTYFKGEQLKQENMHPCNEGYSKCESEKSNSKKRRQWNRKFNQELLTESKLEVDGKVYYSCKQCGKYLHSIYTFLTHIRIHTGERPHQCEQCGKNFRVSQGLSRHMKETHQKIKSFACDLCERNFASRRNVIEHRRIHTNERPYICDLCGKTFKQKASLFVHNRSHTDNFPFKCSYCDLKFHTKPPLKVHITKHTGEKPFSCDVCGRPFRIKYELKRHKLVHSDEKPYGCDICGMKFKQKRYLRNHRLAHRPNCKKV